jgi:hypothetical protein
MKAKAANKLIRQLEQVRGALKVIHTWATFADGCLFDRDHVVKLCLKTLEKTKSSPQD